MPHMSRSLKPVVLALSLALAAGMAGCGNKEEAGAAGGAAAGGDAGAAQQQAGGSAAAWKPERSVTFVVPAGSGGGADQMARFVQGVVVKNKLMDQPMVVLNLAGGAGAEGFMDMKHDKDPHKIIITLSNLFTTPMATGVPFNWKELTPVQLLAMDEFVLWVNANSPHKTAMDYINDCKSAAGKCKVAGTGSKQEDQIIFAAVEKATGAKFTYIPMKGGGDVATQLVGNHVSASVNNPIEAVSQWRGGGLKPLCVFDTERMPYTEKVTADMAWADIPTCKESGIDVTYLMQRSIFAGPDQPAEVVAYYNDLFTRVKDTQDWKDNMQKGAYKQSSMSGQEFTSWLENAEKQHQEIMEANGWIKK